MGWISNNFTSENSFNIIGSSQSCVGTEWMVLEQTIMAYVLDNTMGLKKLCVICHFTLWNHCETCTSMNIFVNNRSSIMVIISLKIKTYISPILIISWQVPSNSNWINYPIKRAWTSKWGHSSYNLNQSGGSSNYTWRYYTDLVYFYQNQTPCQKGSSMIDTLTWL